MPSVTVETAEEFVRSNKRLGADYIKLMQENGMSMKFEGIPVATLEFQTAVVKAAHDNGLLAVAHATSLEDTLLVLRAGADALTHCFTDVAPTDELVEAYKKNNAFLIPTLVVCSSLTGDEQELRDRFAAKATPQQLTANVKETMCQCLGLGVPGATVKHSYESIKKLKAAGIDIVAVSRPAPSFSGEMQTDRSQGNGLRAADEGNSYR
jgi:imidazolonepropionase-like amidohydrolase